MSQQEFHNSSAPQQSTESQHFDNQAEPENLADKQDQFTTEIKQQPELQPPTVQQPQFTPKLEPEPIQNDKIRFAFNATGKNKDWDFRKLAANFQDTKGTIWDVAREVKAGHALCAGLLDGQWRSKKNIIGSQWVLLDIDNSAIWTDENNNPLDENGRPIKINGAWVDINGNVIEKSDGRQAKKIYQHQLNLDEALKHPFIKQYCALIYTTASHKPDWHKFRLVFVLPEFVRGTETVEVLTRYLMQQLPHDPACKDASRVFYGSTEATFPLINPDAYLPQFWIDEAISVAHQERIEYQRRIAEIEKRRQQLQDQAEKNDWDVDQLIQQALSYIPPRSPGSGNYQECLQVLMALNGHYGPSDAEIIAESWSPSIRGTTWNIRAKIKSFRGRSGITIGTLFHIAKQYGFRFPTVKKSTPNYDYLEEREREDQERRFYDWFDFRQQIKKIVKPIKKALKGFGEQTKEPIEKALKGFGKQTKEPPKQDNKPADVDIWFSSQDRDKIYQEIATDEKYHDYKYILDTSAAGSGKSHHIGTLEPSDLKAAKLWYISSDHRNPTTSTIESNYVDLPVRNNGLYADSTQLTPNGNPTIHWPEKGQVPNVKGNCDRAPLFRKLASKGYQNEANSEASMNPGCVTCKYKFNCSSHYPDGKEAAYIPGNTFRRDRKNALLANSNRCHIDSLPSDIPDNSIAFVDEFSRQVNPIQVTELGLNDYEKTVTTIATELPDVWELIKDFISPLHQYLSYSHKEAYYGYPHQEVMEIFGNIDLSKITDIINELKILNPDLEKIFEDADGLDNYEGMSKKLIRTIKVGFLREAAKHSHEMLDDLAVNWLIPLLEIYANLVPGNFRIKNHKLIIATKNTRQVEVLGKFKKVFLLDATANRESVALELGINSDEILVISENLPNYSNLEIVHIADLGLCGKNRSELKHTQIAALTKHLQSKHDRLGVIDHLACVEDGQGYWYVDNRGSNKYINVDALLCIGTPYPDLGAIAQKYSILTGDFDTSKDNPNFQKYVNHLVQAEIIQGVGRPRANRRPEQKIKVYLTTNTDISYLSSYYLGCTIEETEAFKLTPEAGSKTQWLQYQIVQAAKQIWEAGAKITQKAIASLAGVTQGRISQEAAEMGGWTALKKILISLLDSLYSKINNFSATLSENQQFYVEQFLPLLAGEERLNPADVATTLDDIGDEAEVKLVLSRVPFETKLLLIIKLLAHVPDEFVEIITPLIPKEMIFQDGS
ncbi:PriCT-2 domain-containing protein (plasmid) [Okeanomitos corallinicola TIOX110]|uniref:PriCT-2 domain-containing protein n=1 Tax=Okeanomitos corallinicola TIOX110 TaxID=3133117 RepID=A0ABZ2UZV4_9CYAN